MASLQKRIDELTKDITKFVKENEKLYIFLRKQKYLFDKAGFGLSQYKNEKYYKNLFVKSSCSTTHYVTCNTIYIMDEMDISIHVLSRKNVISKYEFLR